MKDTQLLRYSRQIFLPEVDIEGQLKLLNARVLVVGVGGLGSAAVPYLAACGVGHLTLLDNDVVELSNLARQVVHKPASLDRLKVESAKDTLSELNPDTSIETVVQRATPDWFMNELKHFDLAIDCTDNAEVRYALNDAAKVHKVPWVSAAAVAFNGQVTVFDPRIEYSPCYRCLYPNIETQHLSCSESGVLSPLVGVIGTLQAVEALKILLGIGKPLVGRLLTYDAFNAGFNEWKIKPSCSTCAHS